jgi:hypothetical protein
MTFCFTLIVAFDVIIVNFNDSSRRITLTFLVHVWYPPLHYGNEEGKR